MKLAKRRFLERRLAKREEKREKREAQEAAEEQPTPKVHERSVKLSHSYHKSLEHNEMRKVLDKKRRKDEMEKTERNSFW
uniref:GN3L_Grn1 domain-containing protein n=1 Tax=Steinernema glaseri TaxID=37863 RepID=A0A1I8AUG2_9BILA